MSFHAKMSLDDGGNDLVVLSASYCYTQPLDAQNLPNNKSKISVLNVTIASSKDHKIIEWMVSPTMTKAVKITFYDGNGATLKKKCNAFRANVIFGLDGPSYKLWQVFNKNALWKAI